MDRTALAEWPKDFAYIDMPWGRELVNVTWPYIAVSAPEGPKDKALMYHTDDPAWAHWDAFLTRQSDGSYTVQTKGGR